MESRFKDLQQCIWSNTEEKQRFRQLVVNSVMATDIFEKDMKALRNKRWDKAFHRELQEAARELTQFNIDHETNMKATIVIEHIIQVTLILFFLHSDSSFGNAQLNSRCLSHCCGR